MKMCTTNIHCSIRRNRPAVCRKQPVQNIPVLSVTRTDRGPDTGTVSMEYMIFPDKDKINIFMRSIYV